MGIILKVIKISGEKTKMVHNYTMYFWNNFLYPEETTREVKKLYFFPLRIKTVIQSAQIIRRIDGVVDVWYVNKWVDLK